MDKMHKDRPSLEKEININCIFLFKNLLKKVYVPLNKSCLWITALFFIHVKFQKNETEISETVIRPYLNKIFG